jgi:hypothetical protein
MPAGRHEEAMYDAARVGWSTVGIGGSTRFLEALITPK